MAWEGSNRRARLPGNWKSLRARVLRRDHYRCQALIDGRQCTNKATDVDHIKLNDDHSLNNLQSLCRSCHQTKTKREVSDIRKRRYRQAEQHPGLEG